MSFLCFFLFQLYLECQRNVLELFTMVMSLQAIFLTRTLQLFKVGRYERPQRVAVNLMACFAQVSPVQYLLFEKLTTTASPFSECFCSVLQCVVYDLARPVMEVSYHLRSRPSVDRVADG